MAAGVMGEEKRKTATAEEATENPHKSPRLDTAAAAEALLELGDSPSTGEADDSTYDIGLCEHLFMDSEQLDEIVCPLKNADKAPTCEHDPCRTTLKGAAGMMVCTECSSTFCIGDESDRGNPQGHARWHALRDQHWVAMWCDEPSKGYCFECGRALMFGRNKVYEDDYAVVARNKKDEWGTVASNSKDDSPMLARNVKVDWAMLGSNAMDPWRMVGSNAMDPWRMVGSNAIDPWRMVGSNAMDQWGMVGTGAMDHLEMVAGDDHVIRGIPSRTNSCYMNSSLQCLLALGKLRTMILRPDARLEHIGAHLRQLFVETSSANNARHRLDAQMILGSMLSLYPDRFKFRRMEDSHEFLTYLCGALDNEEKQFPTIGNSIFRCELIQTISCKGCSRNSVTHQSSVGLQLAVPSKNPPARSMPLQLDSTEAKNTVHGRLQTQKNDVPGGIVEEQALDSIPKLFDDNEGVVESTADSHNTEEKQKAQSCDIVHDEAEHMNSLASIVDCLHKSPRLDTAAAVAEALLELGDSPLTGEAEATTDDSTYDIGPCEHLFMDSEQHDEIVCALNNADKPPTCEHDPCRTTLRGAAGMMVCTECSSTFCIGEESDRDNPQGHARWHAVRDQHWVAMRCDEPSKGYCFECGRVLMFGRNKVYEDDYAVVARNKKDEWGTVASNSKDDSAMLARNVKVDWAMLGSNAMDQLEIVASDDHVIRGIPNLTKTCYMNSSLQCLLALGKLRTMILRPDARLEDIGLHLRQLFIVTSSANNARHRLDAQMILGSMLSLYPYRFEFGKIEDSHELLTSLCDSLDNEVEHFPPICNSIFRCELIQTISCKSDSLNSVTHQSSVGIQLAVPSKNPPARSMTSKNTVHDCRQTQKSYVPGGIVEEQALDSIPKLFDDNEGVVESTADSHNTEEKEKAQRSDIVHDEAEHMNSLASIVDCLEQTEEAQGKINAFAKKKGKRKSLIEKKSMGKVFSSKKDKGKTSSKKKIKRKKRKLKVQVFIKTLQGRTIAVKVELNRTSTYLMELIGKRTNFNPKVQYLEYSGKILHPDSTLRECGVGKNSSVNICSRMRGGQIRLSEYMEDHREEVLRSKGASTELTDSGCNILRTLVREVVETITDGRCWTTDLTLGDFYVQGDHVYAYQGQTDHANRKLIRKNLSDLANSIRNSFVLNGVFPPYIEHLLSLLENPEFDGDKLKGKYRIRVQYHICYVAYMKRVNFVLQLKIFYDNLSQEDKADFIAALEACETSINEYWFYHIANDPILRETYRKRTYSATMWNAFLFIRNFFSHSVENSWEMPAGNQIYDCDSGLEILISNCFGDFLPAIIGQLIESNFDLYELFSYCLDLVPDY